MIKVLMLLLVIFVITVVSILLAIIRPWEKQKSPSPVQSPDFTPSSDYTEYSGKVPSNFQGSSTLINKGDTTPEDCENSCTTDLNCKGFVIQGVNSNIENFSSNGALCNLLTVSPNAGLLVQNNSGNTYIRDSGAVQESKIKNASQGYSTLPNSNGNEGSGYCIGTDYSGYSYSLTNAVQACNTDYTCEAITCKGTYFGCSDPSDPNCCKLKSGIISDGPDTRYYCLKKD